MAQILLVEPDRSLAQTYRSYLQVKGHQTFWAPTGQLAIQVLDQKDIELVIVELQLAAHNGLEFLYEMRSYADWQKIPVLIQSFVPAKQIEKSMVLTQLEVAEYLYKPQTTLGQLGLSVDAVVQTVAI